MKLLRILLLGLFLSFGSFGSAWAEELVNINTASAEQLAGGLSGVGMKKANAIVRYREEHGYFNSVDQLVNVKGIGEKTVEKLRGLIEVDVPLDYELEKKGYK